MEALHGKWSLDKSKNVNVESFMTAMGYPKEMIDLIDKADTTVEATPEAGKLRLVFSSTGLPTTSHLCALDESFEVTTPEGLKLNCNITADGPGKFREHYSNAGMGVEFTTVREVTATQMKAVTSAKGNTMTQVFNKV